MRGTEAIKRLRERRAELQRLGVEHLFLFGSTARDQGREDSDVDLFFDYPRGRFGFYELMDVKEFAANVLGRKTDIMTRDSLHKALRASIEASPCASSNYGEVLRGPTLPPRSLSAAARPLAAPTGRPPPALRAQLAPRRGARWRGRSRRTVLRAPRSLRRAGRRRTRRGRPAFPPCRRQDRRRRSR